MPANSVQLTEPNLYFQVAGSEVDKANKAVVVLQSQLAATPSGCPALGHTKLALRISQPVSLRKPM